MSVQKEVYLQLQGVAIDNKTETKANTGRQRRPNGNTCVNVSQVDIVSVDRSKQLSMSSDVPMINEEYTNPQEINSTEQPQSYYLYGEEIHYPNPHTERALRVLQEFCRDLIGRIATEEKVQDLLSGVTWHLRGRAFYVKVKESKVMQSFRPNNFSAEELERTCRDAIKFRISYGFSHRPARNQFDMMSTATNNASKQSNTISANATPIPSPYLTHSMQPSQNAGNLAGNTSNSNLYYPGSTHATGNAALSGMGYNSNNVNAQMNTYAMSHQHQMQQAHHHAYQQQLQGGSAATSASSHYNSAAFSLHGSNQTPNMTNMSMMNNNTSSTNANANMNINLMGVLSEDNLPARTRSRRLAQQQQQQQQQQQSSFYDQYLMQQQQPLYTTSSDNAYNATLTNPNVQSNAAAANQSTNASSNYLNKFSGNPAYASSGMMQQQQQQQSQYNPGSCSNNLVLASSSSLAEVQGPLSKRQRIAPPSVRNSQDVLLAEQETNQPSTSSNFSRQQPSYTNSNVQQQQSHLPRGRAGGSYDVSKRLRVDRLSNTISSNPSGSSVNMKNTSSLRISFDSAPTAAILASVPGVQEISVGLVDPSGKNELLVGANWEILEPMYYTCTLTLFPGWCARKDGVDVATWTVKNNSCQTGDIPFSASLSNIGSTSIIKKGDEELLEETELGHRPRHHHVKTESQETSSTCQNFPIRNNKKNEDDIDMINSEPIISGNEKQEPSSASSSAASSPRLAPQKNAQKTRIHPSISLASTAAVLPSACNSFTADYSSAAANSTDVSFPAEATAANISSPSVLALHPSSTASNITHQQARRHSTYQQKLRTVAYHSHITINSSPAAAWRQLKEWARLVAEVLAPESVSQVEAYLTAVEAASCVASPQTGSVNARLPPVRLVALTLPPSPSNANTSNSSGRAVANLGQTEALNFSSASPAVASNNSTMLSSDNLSQQALSQMVIGQWVSCPSSSYNTNNTNRMSIYQNSNSLNPASYSQFNPTLISQQQQQPSSQSQQPSMMNLITNTENKQVSGQSLNYPQQSSSSFNRSTNSNINPTTAASSATATGNNTNRLPGFPSIFGGVGSTASSSNVQYIIKQQQKQQQQQLTSGAVTSQSTHAPPSNSNSAPTTPKQEVPTTAEKSLSSSISSTNSTSNILDHAIAAASSHLASAAAAIVEHSAADSKFNSSSSSFQSFKAGAGHSPFVRASVASTVAPNASSPALSPVIRACSSTHGTTTAAAEESK